MVQEDGGGTNKRKRWELREYRGERNCVEERVWGVKMGWKRKEDQGRNRESVWLLKKYQTRDKWVSHTFPYVNTNQHQVLKITEEFLYCTWAKWCNFFFKFIKYAFFFALALSTFCFFLLIWLFWFKWFIHLSKRNR